jgi:catechol 2,3-dioxygenase-like lactoylglutathione lyase family enzyme
LRRTRRFEQHGATRERPEVNMSSTDTSTKAPDVGALAVSDIDAARDDLMSRGVDVSEVLYRDGGRLIPGPDPQRRSYRSHLSFTDPDGNGCLLQEITTRPPRRERED